MFTILLYSRLLITVLLVWVILYYVINRARQLFIKKDISQSKDSLPLSNEEIQQTMEDEISELEHDDSMMSVDEDYDDVAEPIETVEVEEVIEIDDAVQEENEDPVVVEVAVVEPVISTDEVEEVIAPEALIKEANDAQAKQYEYMFVSDDSSPEMPKDLDAVRNIGQWHSRDDIVRDKFEKHIQKIRYEIWILKQRNDILWYEKKLVEGITLLPNDIDFQKQLADLYFHQGKYKKSQSLLKKILIDNPSDHYALWQVWEIATVEGNNEDAYLYLQQAYATCEDNPKYCFSLAQWYYDHDALDQALPLMEKMVKLRPKNIDYIVSLSHVQHKMWMIDQARQSLLRALELDPMNVTLKNYLKSL